MFTNVNQFVDDIDVYYYIKGTEPDEIVQEEIARLDEVKEMNEFNE